MNRILHTPTLAVIGDTHTLKMIPIFRESLPIGFCNGVFIHAGDCGEGFSHPKKERHLLKKLYEYLHLINSYLIIVRGNHSNPAFFHDNHWANNEFEDRIYFAPDYSIFNINNKSIQIIGGGISIDRIEREINRNWWVNEEVSFQPTRVEKVDILITHIPPTNAGLLKADCNDMVRHYAALEWDQGTDLLRELEYEQRQMQELSDLSQCRAHYFGHMHVYHYHKDARNHRLYRGLSINEFYEIK
jgi:predicted phosphodiesterase